MTTWTTLRIALQRHDGGTRALSRIDFKGNIPESEALDRARHTIKLDRSLDKGYLLNCLDIGNYELTTTE
jgi:hypothetical protein